MSGGTFDYNNHWIGSIADTIQNWIECPDPERFEPRPEVVVKLYKQLLPIVQFVDDVIHHIDYYESGDIGESMLLERVETSADELLGAGNKIITFKEKSPNE